MNSHRRSDGKNCLNKTSIGLIAASLVFLIACQSTNKTRVLEKENPVQLASELDEEVSLKSDREQLNELRKNVPEAQKESNDELAMDLELMGKADRPAHEIRGKFQQKVRKLRQKFRDKSAEVRKKFRDVQKKQRDQFLKNLKAEREDFRKEKVEREATKEFFSKQDRERNEFFAMQKDQRKEFESEINQKSKDFHGNMRERIKQFDEQMRIYSKRKSEKEREEKKRKKEAAEAAKGSTTGPVFQGNPSLDQESQKILKEFNDMKSMPSEKLGQ